MFIAAVFLRMCPVEGGIFEAGFSSLHSDNSTQQLADSAPRSMILYKHANCIRFSENAYSFLKRGRGPFLIQSPIFEATDLANYHRGRRNRSIWTPSLHHHHHHPRHIGWVSRRKAGRQLDRNRDCHLLPSSDTEREVYPVGNKMGAGITA